MHLNFKILIYKHIIRPVSTYRNSGPSLQIYADFRSSIHRAKTYTTRSLWSPQRPQPIVTRSHRTCHNPIRQTTPSNSFIGITRYPCPSPSTPVNAFPNATGLKIYSDGTLGKNTINT